MLWKRVHLRKCCSCCYKDKTTFYLFLGDFVNGSYFVCVEERNKVARVSTPHTLSLSLCLICTLWRTHMCVYSHIEHKIRVSHLTVMVCSWTFRFCTLHIHKAIITGMSVLVFYFFLFFHIPLSLSIILSFSSFLCVHFSTPPCALQQNICMVLMEPAAGYTWKWMFSVGNTTFMKPEICMALDKIVWNNLTWKWRKIEWRDRNDHNGMACHAMPFHSIQRRRRYKVTDYKFEYEYL